MLCTSETTCVSFATAIARMQVRVRRCACVHMNVCMYLCRHACMCVCSYVRACANRDTCVTSRSGMLLSSLSSRALFGFREASAMNANTPAAQCGAGQMPSATFRVRSQHTSPESLSNEFGRWRRSAERSAFIRISRKGPFGGVCGFERRMEECHLRRADPHWRSDADATTKSIFLDSQEDSRAFASSVVPQHFCHKPQIGGRIFR